LYQKESQKGGTSHLDFAAIAMDNNWSNVRCYQKTR